MNAHKIYILIIFLLFSSYASAQHENHQHSDKKDSVSKEEPQSKIGPEEHIMSHSFSRNLPMNRNGSGTGWLPDESPMYGYMFHSKKWMYMFHGNIFLRYNNQDAFVQGSKGAKKIDAPNWFMGMGQRRVGNKGLFRFSVMLSLDPLTIGGEGYPLLYQTGETWQGKSLVNRQHPHDLFSELSIGYTHILLSNTDVFVYVGFPGEPAFGPVAFMHRVSSLYNPDAPLGHHWQDATHITFGVTTVGMRHKNFKIEASNFTGREPDENRYNFDRPRFDSWSARLSYNPAPGWAFQISQARLVSPHQLSPNEDLNKTTASATHSKRLGSKFFWNFTGLWGYNYAHDHHKEHSALAETALTLFGTTLYGKYEWVEKSTEELNLDEETFGYNSIFDVHAFTLGLNQNLYKLFKTHISLGVQGTIFNSDGRLRSTYGKNPVSFEAYFRIYPSLMSSGYQNK